MLVGLVIDENRRLSFSVRWCADARMSLLEQTALHYTLLPTMFLMMPVGAMVAFAGELLLTGRTRHERTARLLAKHLCCFAMMSAGMLIFVWVGMAIGNVSSLPPTFTMAGMMLTGMMAGTTCHGVLSSIHLPLFALQGRS